MDQSGENGKSRPESADGLAERFDDGVFDEDSQASYIYDSDDAGSDASSVNTQDERDYFGDSSVSEDTGSDNVAWVDSDENEELREDLQASAPWLSTQGPARLVQRRTKKIGFKLSRKVFTSKHRIRLFKAFDKFRVAVDTFNVIYLIYGPEDTKAYKIDFFRISDFVYFGNRLLFSSTRSAFLKELSPDGKAQDINKRTGNVRRMCAGQGGLYVAADKLFRFDTGLNSKEVFNHAFTDVCVNRRCVVGLDASGDVFVFDSRLNLIKKHSFPGKFRFKSVFCTEENYFLSTETGFCVLDDRFEIAREFANLKSYATGLVSNSDFVVYGTDCQNSLRIVKAGLACYDRFPFSKVWIAPISCLGIQGDTVYLCHSRYVSSLRITYSE